MSQTTFPRHENLAPPSTSGSAADAADRHGQRTGVWSWLRATVPTLAVVCVLAALAAWGYSSDWTIPSFATLTGKPAEANADWCAEHNVPESICIECNSKLLPPVKDYGWCPQHGVAQCPLEHPDVAELRSPPTITQADFEQADRALALRPRTLNSSHCQTHQRRIQFASVQSMEKAGVDIAVAGRRPIVESVVANGEVVYNETLTAHLASRVAGTVWRVEKQVGDPVKKGDILALIDSSEVGLAKTKFLQAFAEVRIGKSNVERLQPLADSGSIPGRQFREAEAALQEAEIRLLSAQQVLVNLGLNVHAEEFAGATTEQIAERIQFLGLPTEAVNGFDVGPATSNLFPLRSPLDAIVVDCQVVPGEVVNSTTTIFEVSDVRKMWLMLDVRQDEAKYLSLGQTVLFRPSDALDEPEIHGTVAWISTAADDQTRTVKVRVNLPNEDGRLRANTFGRGRIVLREEPQAIVVPSEAVHSDGCCKVVFVRDRNFFKEGSPKFFHIRKVRVGVQDGDTTEIIAGVLPGEVLASKNSVVLESQLLKSNLGAGCGCCTGKE